MRRNARNREYLALEAEGSRNLQFRRILYLEHAFLPIIFVALLAELEKRREEASILFSTLEMSDTCCGVRVGLLVLETEDGD